MSSVWNLKFIIESSSVVSAHSVSMIPSMELSIGRMESISGIMWRNSCRLSRRTTSPVAKRTSCLSGAEYSAVMARLPIGVNAPSRLRCTAPPAADTSPSNRWKRMSANCTTLALTCRLAVMLEGTTNAVRSLSSMCEAIEAFITSSLSESAIFTSPF